jgi:hypothetical protein
MVFCLFSPIFGDDLGSKVVFFCRKYVYIHETYSQWTLKCFWHILRQLQSRSIVPLRHILNCVRPNAIFSCSSCPYLEGGSDPFNCNTIRHNGAIYILTILSWAEARRRGGGAQSPNFLTYKEPKNQFQGTNSASLWNLVGRYDNLIPTRFLAPIDCLKIPALVVSLSPSFWALFLLVTPV